MKILSTIVLIVVGTLTCRSQVLIWSDEFDAPALDVTKWNIETGTGINGDWGTGQQDAATGRRENIAIEYDIDGASGGALRISTRKESYSGRNYTSGRINSKGKASWGPGYRIEARVWPKDVRYAGQGFAFWMMPQEIPPGYDDLMWPQGGEIDIMEFAGSFPSANLGSVHYAPSWNNNEWAADNHWHQGSYYSYADGQVPLPSSQWITIDLGESVSLRRVVLHWENAYAKQYKIQLSTDGSVWTDIHTVTNGNGGTDEADVENEGQYLRILATERGTKWAYSLYEVEAYSYADDANIASGKMVTSSSTEDETLGPANVVDGDYTTRWASADVETPLPSWPADAADPNTGVNGFHIYGIDWHSDRIEFYVDGNVYHIHHFDDGGAFRRNGQNEKGVVLIDDKRIAKTEYSHRFPQWHPFTHKFYSILSAGVGGNNTYGGAIVPEAEFPCDVYVDWVRVYQLGDRVTSVEAMENVTPMGYPNPVSDYYHLPDVLDGTPVTIVDVRGTVVHQTVVIAGMLDVSCLPEGVYFVRYMKMERLAVSRIIKI